MILAEDLKKEIDGTRWFYYFSFILGAVAMAIAGYFLVIGLSKFGGDDTTRTILVVGAVLFQVIESYCFIAAAGFAFHSRRWQLTLFTLGCVLFVFSLFVMTLAQKTAMQTGEMQADVIDSRVKHIEQQIASYDKLIHSYEFNSQKQSRSIYKDSRELGQDSLNKAAGLEEKKIALANELFALKGQRRQTSMDFFAQLGKLTGYDAADLEWYFLIGRAVLFELCGIILLSFGVTLRGRIMKRYLREYDRTENTIRPDTVPGTESDRAGLIVPEQKSGTVSVPESGYTFSVPGTVDTENSTEKYDTGKTVPNVGYSPIARQTGGSPEIVPTVLNVIPPKLRNRRDGSVPENLSSEYILKPSQNNCTGEIVPDDFVATEIVPGTESMDFVPGTENCTDSTDVGNTAGTQPTVPMMESTNIVHLGTTRNKQVLDQLEPELRPLVHDAIAAYERNEINRFTREQVRTVLRINTKNAGIVAKAAKLINESGTALSL